MSLILGGLTLAIWLGLAVGWHFFWRPDQRLPAAPPFTSPMPKIIAVIPARNEQENIAAVITSMAAQDYAGAFEVIVVNDNSTDDTKAVAIKAAKGHDHIRIVDAPDLEPGWAGKMWALSQGVAASNNDGADYYWFTDGDIRHDPSVLSRLVSHAQNHGLGLTSVMVKLRIAGFWEKLLVPAFVFYFTLLYPFRAINNPQSRFAGGAGGCILIRRDALLDIGGIATIKNAIIDDCALAKAVKASGQPIWLGLGDDSYSLRPYDSLGDFWAMVQRSAYTQLHYSPLLLIGVLAGLVLSHLVPVVLAVTLLCGVNAAGVAAIAAWLVMAIIYRPVGAYYGQNPFWALTLPCAAVLFGLMTLSSAIFHYTGWGKNWRGRAI